jgi:hypothetical protein
MGSCDSSAVNADLGQGIVFWWLESKAANNRRTPKRGRHAEFIGRWRLGVRRLFAAYGSTIILLLDRAHTGNLNISAADMPGHFPSTFVIFLSLGWKAKADWLW